MENRDEEPKTPSRRGPFYALTFRNFRLFFVGQIISVIGTWMQTAAQQWYVWELTHDERWLGIISGASAIPYVAFSVWGGQVADRKDRRRVLLWTQTTAMVLALVLAAIVSGKWVEARAWYVAVIAGLMGIVNAFNMPAQQAFVSDMVEERSALGNAIALNSFRFNLARVLGPMLAGLTLKAFGSVACFLLNGLSYIAVILCLVLMRLPPFRPKEEKPPMWEGFGYIGRTRSLFRTVALIAAGSLFAWPVSTLYPVFATRFHAGVSGFSRMMSASGLGAVLGGAILAAFSGRLPLQRLVYLGATLFCGALLLFTLAPSYPLALVCLVFGGFAMILFGMSSNIAVQEAVPDDLRGRVMAVYSLVFNGLMPIGGLEIGFLARHLNAITAVRLNVLCFATLAVTLFCWSLADRQKGKTSPKGE